MKSMITAALLGLIAGGGVAVAHTASADTPTQRVLRADANTDGRITRAEFVRQAEVQFARLDANKDGSLTRDEGGLGRRGYQFGGRRGFGAMAGQDGAERPGGGASPLDPNGDGKITRAESDAINAKMFKEMDANRNGMVDKDEMAKLPPRIRTALGADDGRPVTREAFRAYAVQRFEEGDTNHDGVIDAAELRAHHMGPGTRPTEPNAPAPHGG